MKVKGYGRKNWERMIREAREEAIRVETLCAVCSDETLDLAWDTFVKEPSAPRYEKNAQGGSA